MEAESEQAGDVLGLNVEGEKARYSIASASSPSPFAYWQIRNEYWLPAGQRPFGRAAEAIGGGYATPNLKRAYHICLRA